MTANLAFLFFIFGMLCATSILAGQRNWLHYPFAVAYAMLAVTLYWQNA